MLQSIIAISIGAALGATSRWFLGLGLNHLFPSIPMGTLAANLIGGFLIGFFISIFAEYPELAPHWRLLVITGFLGALTTFSTFSAEIIGLLQQDRFFTAALSIVLHVCGTLCLTILGMGSVALFRYLMK